MTNFQTAQIFGDNMVLQFQKPVSVFGTGTDGQHFRHGSGYQQHRGA